MLVRESMDACISTCTVAKSSIHRSSRLIPSIEFSPTNSPEDEGKLFIHSNPLEKVHIIYTCMTNLHLHMNFTMLETLLYLKGIVIRTRSQIQMRSRPHVDIYSLSRPHVDIHSLLVGLQFYGGLINRLF
jgi:hypothetical protein